MLIVAGLAFFMASCEDDGTDPGGVIGPNVTFTIADTNTVPMGTISIEFNLDALAGDVPMNSVEFLRDGVSLAIEDVTINGAEASANPTLLFGDEKDDLSWTVELAAHDAGEAVYEALVIDEDGESASSVAFVTVEEFMGTALADTLTGVLFNQAGPAGTGGLDLDNGVGTGSSDADAELRDLGINCTISHPNENWRQQIGTVNGAVMVEVDPNFTENFTFDGVGTVEEIQAAFDAGTDLADGVSEDQNCNETPVTDVSDPVEIGDMFAVFANDTYYLVRVDDIFTEAVDPTDPTIFSNADSYTLSIKL